MMYIRYTILLLTTVLLIPVAIHAQDATARMKDHVYFLAADSLEGRLTGTPGEAIAFRYISEQYKDIGLEPLGDNYLQAFDFTFQRQVDPSTMVLIDGEIVGKNDYYPLSYSGNVTMKGVLKHVGYGIEAPENDYNDYANLDDLNDHILVIEVSSPDGKHPHSKYLAHLELTTKIEKAKEKGAAGIIFVNTDPNCEDPSDILDTKIKPYQNLPILFVKEKSLVPDGAHASITIRINDDVRTGHNVIGWINNEAPSTVVIGAHYDHLGYGVSGSLYTGDEPAIHNGADDNASGVAVIMELARYLNDNETLANNNYLFIAFSGEELGLYGSNYFVKNPMIDLDQVNYMVNLDMVGRLDEEGNLAINGVGTSPTITEVVESVEVEGIKVSTSSSGIGPSDHTSFYLKDIPVVHFFTGTHEDYHRPSDDAELVNYTGLGLVYNYLQSFIEQLNDDGQLEFTPTKDDNNKNAPRFTVSLGVIPDYLYDGKGMRIEGVRDGRPADNAGIEDGDIVLQMGPVPVVDMMSYMKGLSQFKKGDTTTVVVQRGEEEKSFEVTF